MATTAVTLTNTTTEQIVLTQLRGRSVAIPPLSAVIINAEDDVVDDDSITRRDLYESTQLRALLDSGVLTRSPSGVFDTEQEVVQTEGLDAITEAEHALIDHTGLIGITGLLDESAHDALDHTGLTGIPDSSDDIANDSGVTGADVTTALDALALGGGGGFFSDGTGTDAAIGKGATTPTADGLNSFAQGDGCKADSYNGFAQGKNCTIDQYSYHCFAQGEGNTIFDRCSVNAILGTNSSVGSGSLYFFQRNLLQGNLNKAYGYDNFLQGRSHKVFGDRCIAQGNYSLIGQSGKPDCVNMFFQGELNGDNLTYGHKQVFMQGTNNSFKFSNNYVENTFIQGYDHNITQVKTECFTQGNKNKVSGYQSFAQGEYCGFNNSSTTNKRSFFQGSYCYTQGTTLDSFFQGQRNVSDLGTTRAFLQGSYNKTYGYYTDISMQGFKNRANYGSRQFVQGQYGYARRSDQKVWGSNRAVIGAAQSSRLIKYVQTTTATETTLATLGLETDKSYAINVKVTCKNKTTNGEAAAFEHSGACAFRDAGGAVLIGGPISLSKSSSAQDPGPANAAFVSTLKLSGTDVLLTVTADDGDASGDDYEWCCDMHFVEVKDA